jgi:hypothetical protein
LATHKGIELSKKLGANSKIVEIGTLLMDVKIGEAISIGNQSEHVEMSHTFTKELLAKYPKIPEKDKKNIEACVLEHHGKKQFLSLESEICCNADCYRFCTVKGVAFVLRYFREMDFENLVRLINNKIEEKWNAVSLDICKKELEPQYESLQKFTKYLAQEERSF